MSDGQKEALAIQALGLLNEQVQARIVHYKAEMETSPELDAITAQVVAQLKAMQAAVSADAGGQKTPEEMEELQTRALGAILPRFFSGQTQFATRILKPIGKKIAKLFFESELHEKSKGDKDKVIHHAEQGVYYVLSRYKNRLRAELEGFEYTNPEIRELTLQMLSKMERDLQVGFLSRRSPELNRVMTTYTAVIADFVNKHLPPRVEQMAKTTLRAAKTASQANSVSYKVLADRFPAVVTGDFEVEEVPAYLPSGEGEHLFLWVEKRGVSTPEAAKRLARTLGLTDRDVSWAGLKDKMAVTRQFFCVPARVEDRVAMFADAEVRAHHPGYRHVPLRALLNILMLQRIVRREAPRVTQPALVVHALQDHTCPVAAARDLYGRLGSPEKRLVLLERSYHVVTVDHERERVCTEVARFVGSIVADERLSSTPDTAVS